MPIAKAQHQQLLIRYHWIVIWYDYRFWRIYLKNVLIKFLFSQSVELKEPLKRFGSEDSSIVRRRGSSTDEAVKSEEDLHLNVFADGGEFLIYFCFLYY